MEPSSPSLLGLPRELRDQIVEFLIEHNNSKNAPPSPPFAGRRSKGNSSAPHDILFPVDHFNPKYPPLVLVNRQLYNEVRENLESLERIGKATAELDLMAKGYMFYPTFTYLPGCLRRDKAFDLQVNLRIFSTESFRQDDGWPRQPGSGFRTLLTLLNNLLVTGPSLAFPQPGGMEKEPYRIETLYIDITFHDLYTPGTWPSTTHEIFRLLKCFSISGIPYPYIKALEATVAFETNLPGGASSVYNPSTWDLLSKAYSVEGKWRVSELCDKAMLEHFRSEGFEFLLKPEKVGTIALSGLKRLGTG
jgi:hypothetical protein